MMFFRDLYLITNQYLLRITRPTQIIYATLFVGCFFDTFYFIMYGIFVQSNAYTSLHFVLDLFVAIVLITYFMEAVPRDLFLQDLETVFRPYVKNYIPTWVFLTIDNCASDSRRNMIIRSYFLMLLFFTDCCVITLKILCFGCLVYFRIHFAISFILFIFFIVSLRTSYRYNDFVVTTASNATSSPKKRQENLVKQGTKLPTLVEQHPYHILQASILPFCVAFSTFDILGSTVKYFHYGMGFLTASNLTIGVSLIALALVVWFSAITNESSDGYHTFAVRWNLAHGFILFIVSEIMLFFSIFWAFFHSSLAPTVAIYCAWPPFGIIPIMWHKAPLLNTSLLVISGIWLTAGHFSLLARHFEMASAGLIWTLGLGSLFTLVQLFEYIKSKFAINDSIFGSVFFLSTGFHGLHVIVGSIMLAVALFRNSLRDYLATQHIGFSTASWYWHFVDAVWLFLFVSVYWWGGL